MRKKIIRALALGVAITFGIQPVYTYAANYTNSTNNVIKGLAKENIFFSETEEGTALDSHKRINAKQLNETQYSLSAAYDYNRKDVLWGDFVCEFTVSGNAIITDYVGSNKWMDILLHPFLLLHFLGIQKLRKLICQKDY